MTENGKNKHAELHEQMSTNLNELKQCKKEE